MGMSGPHDSAKQAEYKPTVKRWNGYNFESGNYPKAEANDGFDKHVLRHFGLPEDFQPTEFEAQRMIISFLED